MASYGLASFYARNGLWHNLFWRPLLDWSGTRSAEPLQVRSPDPPAVLLRKHHEMCNAVSLAQDFSHPPSLAFALCFLAKLH